MSIHKLHPRLQDFVGNNWKGLTPVQEQAFDPIFKRTHCIIQAPTSGGKTEAVLFPLLTRLSETKASGIKILYIAPLKALLNDLALRVEPYAQMCFKEAFKWHGDVSQAEKIQQMQFPSDILLTTPESIEAILLRRSEWKHVFNSLETVVIDEAHYFALTERGAHLMSLLERIGAGIGRDFQRIAVTATIGNPQDMMTWLTGNKNGGMKITTEARIKKEKDFRIHFFETDQTALHNYLYSLLNGKKSIVFDRSRTATEETAAAINERNKKNPRTPVKIKTHHSSVSKYLRETAESDIKTKRESGINAIISTSTLELGIDIGELDQVIQIGELTSSGAFLQRVGRTGRRPGRPQVFYGLCTEQDDVLLLTACVSLGLRGISEDIFFPKRAFHILAHQLICYCLQERGATADQCWSVLSKSFSFSGISRKDFDTLVTNLLSTDYLREAGGGALIAGEKTEGEFLGMRWRRLFAIFDTAVMYNVVDGKKIIGTLDASFSQSQSLPFVFVLGGMEWNTLKIDHERQQILVEKNKTGLPPKWKNLNQFDVPYEVAQEVGSLLTSKDRPDFLDSHSDIVLAGLQDMHSNLNWSRTKWIMDNLEGSTITIWTFAGDKINRTIALLLEDYYEKNKPSYNYQFVTIKLAETTVKTADQLRNIIHGFLSLDSTSLTLRLTDKIKVKWFSKFSNCLPDQLAKQTLVEKYLDVEGLIKTVKRAFN
jgi:ATP-dependent Lhr-like helicase